METHHPFACQSVSRWKRAVYMVKSINVTNAEGTRSTTDRIEGNVEVASNTYGPPFVLRGFLSGCCQPINASFLYTGHSDAFTWWMSPSVYLSSTSRTHNTRFISWREMFRERNATCTSKKIWMFSVVAIQFMLCYKIAGQNMLNERNTEN